MEERGCEERKEGACGRKNEGRSVGRGREGTQWNAPATERVTTFDASAEAALRS